jgi:gliding motility-associated-like protein
LGNFLINGSSCPGTPLTFTITVNPASVPQAPHITYATPKVYTINTAITALAPANTGGAVPATIYGKTTTVAGTVGVTGNTNGTGTAARFKAPAGIVADQAGNLYVGDTGNSLIRKITPAGVVSTFAGSGTIGSANGTGTAASFNGPYGITIDNTGNLYVADHFNNLIRKITPAGVVSTLAGSGLMGFANGQGTAASFNQPNDIAVDAAGNLYIADGANYVVRKITPAGLVSTYAGSGVRGSANGTLSTSSFDGVSGVTIDPSGNMFVAEGGVNRIRKITSAGVVSTFAGTGAQGSTDGPGATATFNFLTIARADAGGYVYIAGGNGNNIRRITPAGVVSTLAGSTFGLAGAADGVGTLATFQIPDGVAPDGTGNIYVADTQNALIRKVVATGYTISPALPAGLTFDTTTGIISGTPTALSPATVYTIDAYNAQGGSTATLSIQVTASALQNQTITFGPISAKTYGGADFAPGATASSGLAVTYVSSNTAVATIVAGKIHIVGAGTSTITASQAGNATFNAAADVLQTLTVNKAAQTITFAALTPVTYGAADITLAATANSGLAVTYASSNTAVATIVNGKIHIVGAGTANITASQAGDNNHSAAADVVHLLTVNKAAQIITFAIIDPVLFGVSDFAPAATSSSGLTVTFTSSNPAVATIVNGQIHIVGVGTSVITALQAGDADFVAAANVTRSLTVSKANQTIAFAAIGTKNIGAADFDPGATTGSGLVITYASSNTAVATIVNGKIHIVGTGTSTITASQAGNANYTGAANVSQTLTVVKASQTITFAAIAPQIIGDPDFEAGATASSGLVVTYTSSNTAVATITEGSIHITGIGTTEITASQNGNATFAPAADVIQTLTVADMAHYVAVIHAVVTPNGDGINDILKFDGITDFPDNRVVLANANGVKIYEQSGYDNASKAFDGHSNITGVFQPQGTYFYMVEYKVNGAVKRKKGYFILKY